MTSKTGDIICVEVICKCAHAFNDVLIEFNFCILLLIVEIE